MYARFGFGDSSIIARVGELILFTAWSMDQDGETSFPCKDNCLI